MVSTADRQRPDTRPMGRFTPDVCQVNKQHLTKAHTRTNGHVQEAAGAHD
jgi:hypothetical protein